MASFSSYPHVATYEHVVPAHAELIVLKLCLTYPHVVAGQLFREEHYQALKLPERLKT